MKFLKLCLEFFSQEGPNQVMGITLRILNRHRNVDSFILIRIVAEFLCHFSHFFYWKRKIFQTIFS